MPGASAWIGLRNFGTNWAMNLPGWRKAKNWRRSPPGEARAPGRARILGSGPSTLRKSRGEPVELVRPGAPESHWEGLAYFQGMFDKHLDLVERRLIKEEKIPAAEKVFSLFEPHTEWIQKGKQRPNVELGHRLLVAADQNGLVQDYDVPVGGMDVDQSVPVADRLLGRYGAGSVASLSFGKGFTRAEDQELLSLYVPTVVMPKRGRRNAEETERESERKFAALRRQPARWRATSTR